MISWSSPTCRGFFSFSLPHSESELVFTSALGVKGFFCSFPKGFKFLFHWKCLAGSVWCLSCSGGHSSPSGLHYQEQLSLVPCLALSFSYECLKVVCGEELMSGCDVPLYLLPEFLYSCTGPHLAFRNLLKSLAEFFLPTCIVASLSSGAPGCHWVSGYLVALWP